MYYRIENINRQIVDVVEGECWVAMLDTVVLHGMFRCDAVTADGIIGSDNDTIYHLAGRPACGIGDYYATQISEAEYEELYEQLELGETVYIEEPVDDDGGEIPSESEPVEDDQFVTLTRAELTRIVTEQSETIQMLTECLMEMSEIVYA